MTVNTKKITSGPYAGNGIADTFSYGFKVQDKTELIVYETDDAGVETVLTVDTDYTVNSVGNGSGGTITRISGALPNNYQWYIRSNYDETQLTAFTSQGPFFPDLHENMADKLTFLIQQVLDTQSRVPTLSGSYSGPLPLTLDNPVAGQGLLWKDDLTGLENIDIFTTFVERAGDSMDGPLSMGGNRLTDLPSGVATSDPATMAQLNLSGATGEVGDLIAVARSLGLNNADVIEESNTTDPIPSTIYATSQQKSYTVPDDAIGKFIDSVVGDVLNTTVGGPYTLTHASGKVQPTGAPSLVAMADYFALVYNPLAWGAPTDGTDAQPAIQAMFDSIEQYSQDTQNSGSFQTPVEIYIGKDFYLASPIVKKYRNNMTIKGTGKLKALAGFSGGDYMLELIACSHINIDGIFFDGGSYACKSALRLSGDGFTGAKRNSTNIKVSKCFFNQFGATGTEGYVVDTLSPNGVPGDYSIDDSEFLSCNWLGSFGGALRLASSEIKIDGGKMSFMSGDGLLPMISLGNGSSVNISDFVFTQSTAPAIKADDGASIGRVSLNGCYNESSTSPIYQQSAGTCRDLYISGGYYAGLDDSDSTFVLFNNACKGQLTMSGVTFQTNGYTIIDLGDSGSYIGDAQTSTTSFKSYYPRVKNGAFSERKMAIQTTQDGDKKRIIDAKYEQLNDVKLQLFVGDIDDFTRLRFLTIDDALRYVDQSGYTECEVQVFTGVTHEITKPFTFSGDVVIQGDGASTTTIDIQAPITVRNGRLTILSATVNYIDGAIRNKGSFVSFSGVIPTAANNSTYLVDHFNGETIFSSCVFKVAGSGAKINNNYRSTGNINYFSTTFQNVNAVACDASTAMCRVLYNANTVPSAGFWPLGAITEASTVASGAVMQYICTVAGQPGTWKATVTVA